MDFFIGNYDIGEFNSSHVTSGVEWTLRIEWMLYFSIPLLYVINRHAKSKRFRYFSIITSIFLIFFVSIIIRIFGKVYTDPRPVLAFASGFLAYELSLRKVSLHGKMWACVAVVALALSAFISSNSLMYSPFIFLLTIGFIVISTGNDIFGFLSCRSLLALGEVSYSIYLIHGVLIYIFEGWIINFTSISNEYLIIAFPAFFAFVYMASIFTYKYIELPFIGAKPINRSHKFKGGEIK